MSVITEIMSSGLLMLSPMDVAMDEGSADVDEVNPGSAGGSKTGRKNEGCADVDEVNPGSAGGIKTGRNCVHIFTICEMGPSLSIRNEEGERNRLPDLSRH